MRFLNTLKTDARLRMSQAATWTAAVRGDHASRLMHRPRRTDPYPTHRRLRARGELVRSRFGFGTATSHALVLCSIASAGRDPERFTGPDRFDISRADASDHLAFSGGIHYCPGAPLARLEGRIALHALATRAPHLRPAGRSVHRPTAALRGLAVLPVTAAGGGG